MSKSHPLFRSKLNPAGGVTVGRADRDCALRVWLYKNWIHHQLWSLVRRRVTRRLTMLQTMCNVLKYRKNISNSSLRFGCGYFVNLLKYSTVHVSLLWYPKHTYFSAEQFCKLVRTRINNRNNFCRRKPHRTEFIQPMNALHNWK